VQRGTDNSKHISISGLGLLERCGEAYRRRYLEGEKIPPGIAAVVGIAVHEVAARNLEKKVATGELLLDEELMDLAVDVFTDKWSQETLLSSEDKAQGAGKTEGQAKDKTVLLSRAHHELLAPQLTPKPGRIEWGFRLPTDISDYDLVGFIDLVEETPDGLVVRDLKTTGKAPAASAADMTEQLTMYNMAVERLDGVKPLGVALDFLVARKPKADGLVRQPELMTRWSKRGPVDEEILFARIDRAVRVIEAGAFTPANQQDSWMCNPRFCGYATTCPFYNGRTSVAAPVRVKPLVSKDKGVKPGDTLEDM